MVTLRQQVDLLGRDDVGRHEVDGGAERANQRAAFERVPVDAQAAPLLPGPGRARGRVLHEFDGQDHAALADFGDVSVRAQVLDAGEHARRGRAIAFEHGLVAENGERGIRRGAGQRIAGVAVGMQEGVEPGVFVVEGVVDPVGGEHHGQWQIAAGETLREAQVIRPDRGLLAGEHRAGAPEAHGDFVGDEMHLVPVAGVAQ